ncbi:3-dehydroquinate synthase [Lacinutrix sp. 5H-3-7-4]|uniref:3-dehydroquinate synthase n=1 Tax=Lacinutrix sp. (strain 5H-3-7-4) TaxID=983544 RepID=UPI00020A35FE|nr:3-dehydroquinate synthase [Lacinutrix sp. 5H-3-7-4]AEH02251.1 3-dehydroquinate synthase [Lacinutrix sp. 5H-3-7-4]
MTPITTQDYTIFFNNDGYTALNKHLKEANYSKVYILADENTNIECVPFFLAQISTEIEYDILEIEAGEEQKNLDICLGLWEALSEYGADRKSVIINIGGGVVTDLGGFVASTFKRGIDFINIPTSLLAMVDASIGGKTGIDLGHLKNQIGVINTPQLIVVDTSYLNTLPQLEMRSGLAEMLKHGLIHDYTYWNKLKDLSQSTIDDLDGLIYESIIIKKNIVEQDPEEKGLRKTLNYGHTLGHAIESYYINNDSKKRLLHGEAIAIGMVLANYLSVIYCDFPKTLNSEIKTILKAVYGHVEILEADYAPIIDLLKYDKKNEHGNVNFVLLEAIGKPKANCIVDEKHIIEAFKFYNL